jgi:hypothetical protein
MKGVHLHMKRSWLLRGGTVLAAGFLLIGAVAWSQELLTVVEREAAIRRDKRTYSPRLETAREGDKVALIAKESPWLRVAFKGVEGWLNESSVSDDPDVVLSTEAVASGVRATEQSHAGRGFSPEVEKKHRENKPQLEPAFKLLDAIEKAQYPEEEVLKFMESGQLVPPAEGGSK